MIISYFSAGAKNSAFLMQARNHEMEAMGAVPKNLEENMEKMNFESIEFEVFHSECKKIRMMQMCKTMMRI